MILKLSLVNFLPNILLLLNLLVKSCSSRFLILLFCFLLSSPQRPIFFIFRLFPQLWFFMSSSHNICAIALSSRSTCLSISLFFHPICTFVNLTSFIYQLLTLTCVCVFIFDFSVVATSLLTIWTSIFLFLPSRVCSIMSSFFVFLFHFLKLQLLELQLLDVRFLDILFHDIFILC